MRGDPSEGLRINVRANTKALGYPDAPIQRVGAPWSPVPFGQILVDAYVPSEADIVRAVRATR